MYKIISLGSKLTTSTYFSDIQVVGLENIPKVQEYIIKDGPLLLYGNHNNQFVDPLLIVSIVPRQIHFIAAAKSMRKPIIGHLGRALGGIPVERPQDLVKRGTGTISLKGDTILGKTTNFLKEVKNGDVILVNQEEILVINVIDANTIQVKETKIRIQDQTFKIQPKVDQSQMFESVWQALRDNKCIGIFPEGGSHDNTTLLPLKPGICIMALGAMQKYGTKVYLQPVGLNYFKGHKFRSKVVIEFGLPFEISSYTQLYNTDKRLAITSLLEDVKNRLKLVTLQAPNYSYLSALMLTRNLYLGDQRLKPKENMELLQRFTQGFEIFKDHPEIKEIILQVRMYNYKLKALGVLDYQVMQMQKSYFVDLYIILYQLFMTILSLAFALPGYFMTFPIAILLDYLSEQERKRALANSKVKIAAKDVIASYKLIASVVVIPSAIVFYTVIFYIFLKYNAFCVNSEFYSTILFLLAWPLYTTAMIRSSDGLVRRARKLKTQILFYLNESKYRKIKNHRQELQQKIRALVEQWASQVIGNKQRLLKVESSNKLDDIDHIFDSLAELGI